ncbi:insulinase family protein [Blastococcus sp. CT_GayMR16]|uniref:insulinase family protein n=1 Tax=Blastococcus sp. CT_GayMR16 TaxID=2559607 RepID=UPI00142F5716|nr:insulinase family protein [Blastococcus sp. CT_GayMR16]
MLQTSIDGIPVFVADAPPPLTAGLVFGVGRADETFVRGGLTHLVEHLAMGAVGRTTIDSNASVDLSRTEFVASGAPDQVVDFLRRVCAALSDLPTDRLAVEVDVLRAEGGRAAPPVVGGLLGELYGMTGPGLASVREPALRSLTTDDVRHWTSSWFTRQNAALWLAGPVPEGITLPLPEGVPPARTARHRTALRTPAWTELPIEGQVALAAEIPPGTHFAVGLEVLRRRVEDELRHRRGVAYAVEADRLPLDAAHRLAVVVSDVRPGNEALAATVLWRELQRLAHEGPTPGELDHERAVLTGQLDDPRCGAEEARAVAEAHVTGIPARSTADLRRDVAALTADQVRDAAATMRDAAVLGVPEPLEPAPGDLPRLPKWSADVVEGRVFTRKRLRGVPKDARLVVGTQGASVVLSETERSTVRWAEAVGLVETEPGEFLLLGRDGFTLPVSAADWRDGDQAVALVQAAVPGELQVTDDDADEGEGLLVVRAPAYKVREAVGLSKHDATIVYNGEWTVVVPDGTVSTAVRLGELTAVLGRRSVALVLRRTHADLAYVLLRGGTEIARHQWGVTPGDPRPLAEATGRPDHHITYLHGVIGTPDEVAAHAVQALALPPEVPALLAGAPVAGEHVVGRGALGGFRASVRGEFDPPPGTTGGIAQWERLNRDRPPWYRIANGASAVVCAVLLVLLFAGSHGLQGRLFGTLTGLVIIGLLGSLWGTLPPRRRGVDPQQAAQRAPADVTPSG